MKVLQGYTAALLAVVGPTVLYETYIANQRNSAVYISRNDVSGAYSVFRLFNLTFVEIQSDFCLVFGLVMGVWKEK